MPADSLVKIADINFAYDDRSILKGVTMDIPRGKLIAIMGNSGCGKTTLLRLIGGQLKPTSGTLLVDGESVPVTIDANGVTITRNGAVITTPLPVPR